MKTILKILVVLAIVSFTQDSFGQTQNFENGFYIGTWKYQSGNNIFRLTIFQESAPNPIDGEYYLRGNYTMSNVQGNTETIIYTSDPSDTLAKMSCAFSGLNSGNFVSGLFREIHEGGSGIKAAFSLTPEFSCLSCPAKVHWKVERMEGLRFVGQGIAQNLVVPDDIILIKQ